VRHARAAPGLYIRAPRNEAVFPRLPRIQICGIVARCGSQEATHDAYRKSDRIATVDRDIVLSPDGGNLTSNDVARFRDLAGNLLGSRCAAVTGTRLNGRADLIREIEEYVAHNRHAGTLDLDCLRGDDRPKRASP